MKTLFELLNPKGKIKSALFRALLTKNEKRIIRKL